MGPGLGLGEGVMPESVLRAALDVLDVLHPPEALALSLLDLLGPVVRTQAGGGVGAVGAAVLLDVVGLVPAPAALVVDLGVALSETLGSLSSCHDAL